MAIRLDMAFRLDIAIRLDIARAVYERAETSMYGSSGQSKSIARGNSEDSRGRGSTVQL